MTAASTVTAPPDGCRKHGMSEAEVQHWWQVAEARDLHVGMCRCCFGPCPLDARPALCKRCSEVGD